MASSISLKTVLCLITISIVSGFIVPQPSYRVDTMRMMSTVAPSRPKTMPKTDEEIEKGSPGERRGTTTDEGEEEMPDQEEVRKNGPLEYLMDEELSRMEDDPYHILLLGETYEKPKITVNYVSGNLQLILEMPYEDAVDHSIFAKDQGMSCLGTWKRKECISLGKQLQARDVIVRVVPFTQGGQRGWQANKDAADNSNEFSSSGGGDDGSIQDAEFWS
mmetsp:Transcript_22410/g.25501  ORF Transcript_22410/g.25501 Transcript_22410/m.25501 type:complete len:219 (+) Transcript_22410:200-856(+)